MFLMPSTQYIIMSFIVIYYLAEFCVIQCGAVMVATYFSVFAVTTTTGMSPWQQTVSWCMLGNLFPLNQYFFIKVKNVLEIIVIYVLKIL